MTILDKSKLPLKLSLLGTLQNGGGFMVDATSKLIDSWQRSIRSVGGYWIGYANFKGSVPEMLDLFTNGLGYGIRESASGITTWEGFLAEMNLTYKGQTYRRSWSDVSNRVKCVYSKIGENLIDNPSCEAAVWDAYGSPTTRERSTTWVTQGTYSAHIVADAANDGVVIDSSITLAGYEAYQGRVTVKIISGIWRLEAYSGSNIIDYTEEDTVGQTVMYVNISSDDKVTSVGLRLYCVDTSGEIYADAAVFQLAPLRAESSWQENVESQAEYGIKEEILLQAGMTDAAADALVTRTLAQKCWAKVLPPSSLNQSDTWSDSLHLTFLGYAFTLGSKYSTQVGVEANANTLIENLVSGSQYISAGLIAANTMPFYVEDMEAYRAWDVIKDVANAGDAVGNRWVCGIYNDRKIYYHQAVEQPVARLRGGMFLDPGGGALQGWTARPGWVMLDDIPRPVDFGVAWEETMRGVWMDEVNFSVSRWLDDRSGLSYRSDIL